MSDLTIEGGKVSIEVASLFTQSMASCLKDYKLTDRDQSVSDIPSTLTPFVSMNETYINIETNMSFAANFSLVAENYGDSLSWKNF